MATSMDHVDNLARNHLNGVKCHDNHDDGTSYTWPPWCTPLQVNSLIRHGFRNLKIKEIENFERVFHRICASIKESDAALHASMKNVLEIVTSTKPKALFKEGRTEQKLLAQRTFRKYSSLFEDAQASDVRLVTTTSQRAADSCDVFRSELQKLKSSGFEPEVHVNDPMLKSFDCCIRYLQEVRNNKKAALAEYYKYVKSNFERIAAAVTERLGLPEGVFVHSKEVKALYLMCDVENRIFRTSHMAALFSVSEMEQLEYATDLKCYWKKSYGHKINYKQSCPLMFDVLHHMDQAVQGEKHCRGVFQFAHAETLLPLVALLGLFKDNFKLRADNSHLHRDRNFRTRQICPCSGNIQFVLFDCKPPNGEIGVNGLKWERFMVQLLMNEKPVKLPEWDYEFCPYSVFRERYQSILESCDMESGSAPTVLENDEQL